MKRYIAVVALAAVASPAVASAMPAEPSRGHLTPPPLVQPAHPELPSRLPAKGTDVAAPDQQASKPGPVAAVERSDSARDWTDAGLGALAGSALAAFAIAGAAGLRRRRAAALSG